MYTRWVDMSDVIYCLYVFNNKKREIVLEGERSIRKVRNVALKRSRGKINRPGWKIEITRDGKVLKGGRNALDQACYERWLQENQPSGN